MRERKLFLGIFLWFLGAMLLMVLVSVLLTVFMTQQGIILTGGKPCRTPSTGTGKGFWSCTRRKPRPP